MNTLEKRLREQEKKFKLLKSTLSLIERGIDNKLEVQHLKNFLKDFSAGFNMLDAYDHEKLDTKGRSDPRSLTIKQIAEKLGISYVYVYRRMKQVAPEKIRHRTS